MSTPSLTTSHSAIAGMPSGEIRNATTVNTIPPVVCPVRNRTMASSIEIPDANDRSIFAQQNRNVKTAHNRVKITMNGAARILKMIRIQLAPCRLKIVWFWLLRLFYQGRLAMARMSMERLSFYFLTVYACFIVLLVFFSAAIDCRTL